MCWVCPNRGFVIWFYDQTGFLCVLCKNHLDIWLDNADDDEGLEPSNVIFL